MGRGWMRVLLVSVAALLAAAPGAAAAELPLGPSGLVETRSTRALAPGLELTEIVRGQASVDDAFVVDVGFGTDRSAAEATAARLRSAGYDAEVVDVDVHAPDEPLPGPVASFARAGRFASRAEAQAAADAITGLGFTGVRVSFTGEDGTATTGPWRVHVLEVDPRRFTGSVAPVLATTVVPGRETVTAIAARTGALATVNGGYFVIGEADGTDGDLAGLSMLGGELISEAVNGRTSLVLERRDGGGARVAALSSALTARAAGGAQRVVDGRNRAPGLIRSCGGVGGDAPTERPLHDFTCTDPSELIEFTPRFGAATDPRSEVEAALDRRGRVLAVRGPGGPIPLDGSVLAGTGDAAAWLRDHAAPGRRIRVTERVGDGTRSLRDRHRPAIVNGGPRLVRDGAPDIEAAAEGFVRPGDPQFFYGFGIRRNPRTLAGVTASGRLLLVTVDGRAPGYSVGLSFAESAELMRALGAADAVNLDGGGSTATAIGAALLTRPSDATGERPVGDAIAVLGG